mmetsp:Transcript_101954/g.263500  ORF Transcript_101954/g.263500 Transcript_101954/m.263500 type:complete len:234 (-) Transcript_101954:916-1617(-)
MEGVVQVLQRERRLDDDHVARRHHDPGELAVLPRAPREAGPRLDEHPEAHSRPPGAPRAQEARRRGDDPEARRRRPHQDAAAQARAQRDEDPEAHPRRRVAHQDAQEARVPDEDGDHDPMCCPPALREEACAGPARRQEPRPGSAEGRDGHPAAGARVPRPEAAQRLQGEVHGRPREAPGRHEAAGHGAAEGCDQARGRAPRGEAGADEQGRDLPAQDVARSEDPAEVQGAHG